MCYKKYQKEMNRWNEYFSKYSYSHRNYTSGVITLEPPPPRGGTKFVMAFCLIILGDESQATRCGPLTVGLEIFYKNFIPPRRELLLHFKVWRPVCGWRWNRLTKTAHRYTFCPSADLSRSTTFLSSDRSERFLIFGVLYGTKVIDLSTMGLTKEELDILIYLWITGH